MIPVESGRQILFFGGIGKQVTRQLPGDELIKPVVLIEGMDHPVTPGPHGPQAIVLIPVAVRIPGQVQPVDRHPLSIVLVCKQTIHRLLIGLIAAILQKGILACYIGGQSRQVDRNPAQQGLPIRFLIGLETFLPEFGEDEMVDLVAHPFLFSGQGQFRFFRWDESPMLFVLCTLPDPFFNDLDLQWTELQIGRRRRHQDRRIGSRDPVIQFRLSGFSLDNDVFRGIVLQCGKSSLLDVQAKPGFPLIGIRAVAFEASVGQDGPDMKIEIDLVRYRCAGLRAGRTAADQHQG